MRMKHYGEYELEFAAVPIFLFSSPFPVAIYQYVNIFFKEIES